MPAAYVHRLMSSCKHRPRCQHTLARHNKPCSYEAATAQVNAATMQFCMLQGAHGTHSNTATAAVEHVIRPRVTCVTVRNTLPKPCSCHLRCKQQSRCTARPFSDMMQSAPRCSMAEDVCSASSSRSSRICAVPCIHHRAPHTPNSHAAHALQSSGRVSHS
jgi:hypothetical protein